MSWRMATVALLTGIASAACHGGPPTPPGDSLLEAIRGEEREGNLTYVESQGRRLFVHYCATCHGDEAKGDGQNASNLKPAPPDMTDTTRPPDPVLIRRVIAEGSAAVGRSPQSPPWGRSLSRQEIDYLVAYCLAIGRKKP